ncbi:MAG TPA: hypothetical protein VGL81_06465 [Polyangiaceae bacterium]|jgi:hypothetical protein
MKHACAVALCLMPLLFHAAGCGGSSNTIASCPVDPACYVVSASGECSLDPGSVCVAGEWECSAQGTLGSGCLPDGGIARPPVDAGGCVLDTLDPPLACSSNTTCAPYGGHCEYPGFDGPGECACGSAPGDAGCIGPECGVGVCTLPSFEIPCAGPSDASTCAQYGALCVGTGPFECACVASDPPHGGPAGGL